MSGVFQNIDPPPPHRPASVYFPPLVRGEDTLAGRRGGWGGGVNILEDADTALYSTYVSTLWSKPCLSLLFLHSLVGPSDTLRIFTYPVSNTDSDPSGHK
jgi:hypothetical protein